MTFSAFSPLNGGQFYDMYATENYPLHLGAGQDYTRFGTGIAKWPAPLILGHVDGFCPQFNAQEWFRIKDNKTPYGPYTGGGIAVGAGDDFARMFPNIQGSMQKVTG
jgi:hypothetical protein